MVSTVRGGSRSNVARSGEVARAAAGTAAGVPARGTASAWGLQLPNRTPPHLRPTYPTRPDPQGTNPDNLKWFVEGELTNGRWAMAAVAGILFTDLVGLPKFWLAGAEVGAGGGAGLGLGTRFGRLVWVWCGCFGLQRLTRAGRLASRLAGDCARLCPPSRPPRAPPIQGAPTVPIPHLNRPNRPPRPL